MKAAVRLGRKRDDPDAEALENAKSFGMDCSEFGDDRPLSEFQGAHFCLMASFLLHVL